MPCKSVLIIDDDKHIRESISEALEIEGYKILEASNGKDALNLLQNLSSDHLPGMILLDMQMPVMNGAEFINALMENSESEVSKIPIVIATAKGSTSTLTKIPLAKARIPKPMDLDELYKIVEKYCCQ